MAVRKPQTPVINRSHPLAAGLVLDASFFEQGGVLPKDLASGRQMHFYNNTSADTYGPSWVMDIPGSVVKFDGSNDLVYIAQNSLMKFTTGSISIEALIKPTSLANVEQNIIRCDPGGSESPRRLYLLRVHQTTGVIDFQLGQIGGNFDSLASTGAVTTNSWWHIVAVRNASDSTNKIYINGVLDKSAASTNGNIDSATNPHSIGAYYDQGLPGVNGAPFTGSIAYVREWTRPLKPDEIRQLYINPWQIYQNPAASILNMFPGAVSSIVIKTLAALGAG